MKAFPIRGWNGYEETISEGMDLRDYFAIHYISGFISNPASYAQMPFETLARLGYAMADAMMKAREV